MKNIIIATLLLVIGLMLLRYNYIKKVWNLDYGECQWSECHYYQYHEACKETCEPDKIIYEICK